MKNSQKIFRGLLLTLIMSFAFAATNSFVKGETKQGVETLASCALMLPITIGQNKIVSEIKMTPAFYAKKKNRDKNTPAVLLDIQIKRQLQVGGGSMNNNAPIQSGDRGHVGYSTKGNQVDSVMLTPELSYDAILGITFIAAAGYNGTDKISFIPQYTDETLPTGITFRGDTGWSSYALYVKFFANNTVVLGDLQATTDDEGNFTKSVTQTKYSPAGFSTPVAMPWNSINKNPQNYDQKTRQIQNTNFFSGSALVRYEFAMNASTYMSFSLKIVGLGGAKNIMPVS